jgi:UDPglucose 6-dehydrogenase
MIRKASPALPATESYSLSVVGLGKLGLCMAGAFAEAGFHVIGVDINRKLVDMVTRGKVPYHEKNLDRVLRNGRKRLIATTNIREAVLNSDTTFIVVATPTQPDGTYGNEQLESALTSIAQTLRSKRAKHRIVVSCTVMPGAIEAMAIPLVEKISGKKLGRGFSIAYNPEFIAMGDVIGIFTQPDFVLVGESEPGIGKALAEIYSALCPNHPPVSRMNLISAEIAKISLNCFVTTKITYANMLAELCEKLPGANVDVITAAIGQDARIGGKVLRGGIGFGGPCFPRDNRAFVRLARDHGMEANLARQTHETNVHQLERLQALIVAAVPKGGTIAILGLAYRTDTPLVEESQALLLAKHLAGKGYKVKVHDYVALENARRELGEKVTYCESPIEALKGSDGAVVTMMDPRYRKLTAKEFLAAMKKGGVVFDPWRLYIKQDFKNFRYRPLGVGL